MFHIFFPIPPLILESLSAAFHTLTCAFYPQVFEAKPLVRADMIAEGHAALYW